jgi:Leucine-rich repeat (LRR) protein
VAKWEQLAAEAAKCNDWKALVAAGDVLYAAQRYKASVSAYERSLTLMAKDKGTAPTVLAEVKDRAERSAACLKTEGFYESIRRLSAEEQVARVTSMLSQIYADGRPPGGSIGIGKGTVAAIAFDYGAVHVRWLDALRGIPLESLNCSGCPISDLGPLRGMPLTTLYTGHTAVADLTPLIGMPLAKLGIQGTKVRDLSPLKGMKLRELCLDGTAVADLSALDGMPLTLFRCPNTKVADVAPLKGMLIEELEISGTAVSDLSPLRGMPLKVLLCWASWGPRLRDLSPLKGMPLRTLDVEGNYIVELDPLRGMPLKELYCADTSVTDLTPLEGMRLELLSFTPKNIRSGIGVVRAMSSLTGIGGYKLSLLKPDDFWKRYDAGEFSK